MSESGALKKRTTAIILAGGTGKRMGEDIPKQFMLISGKPLISYSVRAFDRSPLIDDIVIVCHVPHSGMMRSILDDIKPSKECRIVAGGGTRQESSYNGVKMCHEGTGYVLIHDAARPFVGTEIIVNVLEGALGAGAAVPAVDMEDTVIVERDGYVSAVPDRKGIKRVQTPQGFGYNVILEAHREALSGNAGDFYDDGSLVLNAGGEVLVVQGSPLNVKITAKADLARAEELCSRAEKADNR